MDLKTLAKICDLFTEKEKGDLDDLLYLYGVEQAKYFLEAYACFFPFRRTKYPVISREDKKRILEIEKIYQEILGDGGDYEQ